MHPVKAIATGTILAVCTGAYAQSGVAQSSGAQAGTPHARAKGGKAKTRTQEQILLEQLNEKFRKLDELNQKYDSLQQKFDALQKNDEARDAELQQARKDAAEAKQKLAATEQAVGPDGANVTNLQTAVAALTSTSSSLTTQVQQTQQQTQQLLNPETIHFKGIDLKPGGYLAAETVDRQRAVSGDVNTPFAAIPFPGQTSGLLSEFNASGRQSRISLLAEGKLPSAKLRGYYEADFLSAGTTSNNNLSNSYTLRQRQVWAQAALNSNWTITGGQMWSLATEYNHGLNNLSEAIPLTIDAQYNAGFTWARQYGFRVVKQVHDNLSLGFAVEEAQTLNIGGHNLPTLVFQQTGNSGGLYNPTANYSLNYAPDLLAKAAYDSRFGHFEVFGVGRFFRDRVYPNGPAPSGAAQPATTSALGAFTSKKEGGGIGANARVSFENKKFIVGAHALIGDGIGRYGSSTLPDATAHSDGTLELLTGVSALGTFEWHPTPRFDFYSYYGGDYAKRAYYASGLFVTTPGPTQGEPILEGYGAPTNVVSGCYLEVLPAPSPNGGGNVTAGPSSCNADTRNVQEGTAGYWFRFYRGVHGTLQQGVQYSYVVRHTWEGIGNPAANLPNSPKAIDNMWFTSFRYYLPQ